MKKGVFITLEGPEGSGKSSLASLLHSYYTSIGLDVVITKEPGGVDIAEQIRHVILNKDNVSMDGYTELLLYIAARRQHLVEKVIPALEAGKIVICDRFIDSTYAYQGYGRGIDLKTINLLNEIAADTAHYPVDLTLLLDIKPEIGLSRIASNGRETNRLDVELLAFHEKVREGYLAAAKNYPNRIKIIDAASDLTSTYLKAKMVINKHLTKMSREGSGDIDSIRKVVRHLESYRSDKKIIVFTGPSGSGKTTVIDIMNAKGYPELVSHTTRQKRIADVEGKNYFFVTDEQYDQIDFVEQVHYTGNRYGLSRAEIERKLSTNNIVVIAAAIDGALAIKEQYPAETIMVFLDATRETCFKRMTGRGDTPANIAKRMQIMTDARELDNGQYCDYVIDTENVTPSEIVNSVEQLLNKKKIMVFIGSSGSGKTALVRGLNKDGIPVLVTHTTRAMRQDEVDGIDYHFVTEDEFMKIEKIEYACYAGNYYGISKKEIDDKLSRHNVVAVITSIEGGEAIRKAYPQYANLIFVSVEKEVAIARMRARGDSEASISRRIMHMSTSNEFDNWKVCDFIVDNNGSIASTFAKLRLFIQLMNQSDLRSSQPQQVENLIHNHRAA